MKKQYIVQRLYQTAWTPSDQSYQEDLGLYLVPPDDLQGEKERIPLERRLPLACKEDDEVTVTTTPTSLHIEITSRVVTERRAIAPATET